MSSVLYVNVSFMFNHKTGDVNDRLSAQHKKVTGFTAEWKMWLLLEAQDPLFSEHRYSLLTSWGKQCLSPKIQLCTWKALFTPNGAFVFIVYVVISWTVYLMDVASAVLWRGFWKQRCWMIQHWTERMGKRMELAHWCCHCGKHMFTVPTCHLDWHGFSYVELNKI